jgi:radical SAM protein with 4Fe4S-binding SPASM domain
MLNYIKNSFFVKKNEALLGDKEGFYSTKWLNIEFFSGCNLRCTWCSLDHTKEHYEISLNTIKRVFDELIVSKKFKLDRIDLHNAGEIFLHKNINEILEYIGSIKSKIPNHPTISILTNATIFKEDTINTIFQTKCIDEMRFSFDGGNKESFESIRINAKYDKVYNNISSFLNKKDEYKSNITTEIICIVPPEKELSQDWMDEDFKFLLSKVDKVNLRYPHEWDGSSDIELSKNHYITNNNENKICYFLSKNLVVLPNGDVTVCCADLNSRGVIGNVNNNKLESIFMNTKRLNMLNKFTQNKKEEIDLCKNCIGYYDV